jgi:hypothetical protein
VWAKALRWAVQEGLLKVELLLRLNSLCHTAAPYRPQDTLALAVPGQRLTCFCMLSPHCRSLPTSRQAQHMVMNTSALTVSASVPPPADVLYAAAAAAAAVCFRLNTWSWTH